MKTKLLSTPDEQILARPPDAELRALVAGAVACLGCVLVALLADAYTLSLFILVGGGVTIAELWPVRARIGPDGLALSRHGCSWFVPFADVERIEHTAHATLLVTSGGRVIKLYDEDQKPLGDKALAALNGLTRRCRRAQVQDWPLPPRDASTTLADWMVAIRVAPDIHRGVLLSIAAHPGAPPVHRAMAALLLRSRLDELEHARLCAAAEHTASSGLTEVLRLAVHPATREVELAEAVARLDQDARQSCEPGRLLPLERVARTARAEARQAVHVVGTSLEQAAQALTARLLGRRDLRGQPQPR